MGFEKVSTEIILSDISQKESAWKIIIDFQQYSAFMDNVEHVKIHERNQEEGKSEWFINVEGAPLTWVEKDFLDPQNFEVHFESIEGDFDSIRGRWKIDDFQSDKLKIQFSIEYDLGIPVLEEVLGHILKEKMQSNIDAMMNAIKKELMEIDTEESV